MDPSASDALDGGEGSDAVPFSDLLGFASRAQTLISELLLLSSRIPTQFRDRRYDPVLFDLRYFESPDDYEARIEGNSGLEALEDELREACGYFMQRFFLLANAIISYYHDLLKYLNDLQKGVYVHSTLVTVMENENGRQWLTESLSLFGCLLFLQEHHMGGSLREKLLVAHVRHDRCFDAPNLDNICTLCRVHPSTLGSVHQVHSFTSKSAMMAIEKPEDLFARFPFPKPIVDGVICHLRDDDLYNRVRHYPDPEHRIVALGSQAGCLYLLLFFSPEFLHNGFVMREIVDRFFKHCWVVPIFLYFTVDLSQSWDAYKAAKMSLSASLTPAFVHDLSQLHCTKVKDLLHEIESVLLDGILTRDYVLSNAQSLLSLVRSSNVSLRWLLLHRSSIDKGLQDIITSVGTVHQVEEETLLLLLLKTSQLEFELKQLYIELLESKEALWQESRSNALNCIQGLSEYLSGSWALSWKIKDESLKDWFWKLALEVNSLDYTKTGNAGRKLYQVLSTLKEIENFQQVDDNLQIKQHLSGIQKYFHNMLRVLNFHQDTLSSFTVVTDAVYAWEYVGCFKARLFKMIEQDSSIVLNLHSLFLKFKALLESPLLRISQNHSPDLPSVLNFYYSEYKGRIFATLEVIPMMLSRTLNDDLACTLQPINLPSRIERDQLQDFMQVEEQFRLAKAVNKISVFSQGIQIISKAFLGFIDMDLKKWLEEEIRKDLSRQFKNKLKSFFLSTSVGLEELEANVQAMTKYILTQLNLLECCQDLIHIQGIHIWEEVLMHIFKDCAKEEHDAYFRGRDQELIITSVKSYDFSKAKTFLGHLLNQILQLTNPARSIFLEPMSGWFDAEGHELLGLHFFDLFESCVGPVGLISLDSLLAFLVRENLIHAVRGLNKLLDARILEDLQTLDNALGPPTSLPSLGFSSYKYMAKTLDTFWEPWIEHLACIGQLQLLRSLVSLKLKSACKIKAGILSFATEGVFSSILCPRERILKGDAGGVAMTENDETTECFVQELTQQGILCGFCTAFETIYISESPPSFLARCASTMTISQLDRYVLDNHLGTLTSRLKKVALDFSPMVIGLGSFLRQFDPIYVTQYVQHISQYTRMLAETTFGARERHKGSADPSSEVLKSAFWLTYFCKHVGVSKNLLDSCLPPSLLSVLQT